MHNLDKSLNPFIQSICTLILISCIQNTISQTTPTSHFPTPTPINQPTLIPTPMPFELCCDCTTVTLTPGCPIDPDCEDEICSNDAVCCDFEWDAVCTDEADEICNPPTISPTHAPTTSLPLCCACTIPSSNPGCSQDQTCADIICTDDNYCCNIAWDAMCVPEAQQICIDGTSSPTTSNPTLNPTIYPTSNPSVRPTINPTIIPTFGPTNNPTMQPINNPTYNPTLKPTRGPTLSNITHHPTSLPTEEPTKPPSSVPTMDPTEFPTELPTMDPSIFPTNIPTMNPSILPTMDPTDIPTNIPTDIPTMNPSILPTMDPTYIPSMDPTSILPTMDPTNIPTKNPSIVPTIDPTYIPTISTSIIPSMDPTLSPSLCPECYKYWIKLINIEQEDENIDTEDCEENDNNKYWKDSDSSNGDKNKNRNKKRKRGWHKRRRLNNDKGHKYWYNEDENETEEEGRNNNYNKCTGVNGWGETRRRFIDNNNDCDEDNISERQIKRRWYNWAESDEDEDDDDNILTEICLTYVINKYSNDCGELDALFLPLCNNYNNETDLTPDDLTAIISNIYPNNLIANGEQISDILGIKIVFNNNEFINKFVLCLKNISIDENYVKNDFDKITISNWVIFKINNIYEGCTNNDGLPCFNFVVHKKCDKSCECNNGMTQITTKYIGDITAKMIIFYYYNNELCVFLNVATNEEIKCSVEFTIYKQLLFNTEFAILYEDNTPCNGNIDTSCSSDIYMTKINGNCLYNKLQIVGYVDVNGNICDENVFSDNNNNDNGNVYEDNALLEDNKHNEAFNIITFGINTNWKMEIIIIICVLIALICIAFYYLFYSTKLYYEYHKTKPINQNVLTITDYNNDSDQSSDSDKS